MPKRYWILVALIYSCASRIWAASQSQYVVDTWDTEKGLPGNSVIAITQTQDGYLWLGTLYGLARFDGIRFVTFNEANTPGLNSSRIVKLYEDRHGQLWIGTDAGGIYVVNEGKVKNIELRQGVRQGRLLSICEDAVGAVWLYTSTGELARYQTNRVDVWNTGAGFPSRLRGLAPDGNYLWVGTDLSLVRLGPLPAGPAIGLTVAAERAVRPLDFISAGREGRLWQLADGHIQRWKGDQAESGFDWAYPWKRDITPVNAVCEDSQGHLVVGTGGEGLFWFDAQGKYVSLARTNSGLPHDTILSLCLDREGNVWVGTDGGGLCRIRMQAFHVLDGTQGATVQSVCEDKDGGLWIGYYGDRIDHWHGGVVKQFGRAQGLVDVAVKSVLVDSRDNVWAGTVLGGLRQEQQGVFAPAQGSALLTRNDEVSALFEDSTHRLWAGTEAGLASWDGRSWRLLTNGVTASGVRAIAEDRQHNLWIGTHGAGLLWQQGGQFTVFSRTNGLPSDNISSIYVDADGVVWVSTPGGLARYAEGKWTSYVGKLGEVSESVGYVLEDERGYLWLGSNGGLLRVSKKHLNDLAAGLLATIPVRSYGKADGMPTRECSQGSQPAACRSRDGLLWFPTIRGLVTVDPKALTMNTIPPPVVIEGVFIDGELLGTNTLRAPSPVEATVPARAESLEIQYTSLNLSAPDKGLFQYKLAGHENSWTTRPGTERAVRYTKLPHGHYTFQVKACNEDGVWTEAVASLAVTVLPPFWQTWWFLTIISVALLSLVVGSVHYVSTQRLQRQLAVLRQQEALERERARIARDLHDQLGANLTQVALLGEMAETDKDLPKEVEAHARQISQTARDTTRALDEIVWTFNPSNDTLDGLMNYVCKYAQEYLALAGLRYRLEVPSQLPHTPITPEFRHNVFLVAKESINNIVKHAKASEVRLRLRLEPDSFVIEIEDDGRGLAAADEAKGRNGLRNMRKRMEDIGGTFEIGPGADRGTLVRLTAVDTGRGPTDAESNPARVS